MLQTLLRNACQSWGPWLDVVSPCIRDHLPSPEDTVDTLLQEFRTLVAPANGAEESEWEQWGTKAAHINVSSFISCTHSL